MHMPSHDRVQAVALPVVGIDVDENGAPVTCAAVDWLVCFVPGLREQWWHRFAHRRHKHVFAMRPLEDGTWLIVEPWWSRMMVRVLPLDQAIRFLRWGAAGTILHVAEHVPGAGSQFRGWHNCSVLIAFLLGRRYRTWTPNGLLECLDREPGTRRVDLSSYVHDRVETLALHHAQAVLSTVHRERREPLQEALLRAGSGIMASLLDPVVLALHRTLAVESGRFPDAARALWTLAPMRVTDALERLLAEAVSAGEMADMPAGRAARVFMALLRGDLYQRALFGMSVMPRSAQLDAHVRSVVAVFLKHVARPEKERARA